MMKLKCAVGCAGVVLMFIASTPALAAFITDGFGPMGFRGISAKDSITVKVVEKGSPSDGKLKKGDVIVGLTDSFFGKDSPRHAMAKAIDVAETEAAGGKLTLTLKDNRKVVLMLPVLGSYSPTAPYDCPKSDKIITQLADRLLRAEKKLGSGATRSSILGLLATGEKKYMDAAIAAIRGDEDLVSPDPERIANFFKGGPDLGSVGWYWGYDLITLGEYYLLTKDESVLPGIRTYALGLAVGQDAAGLWGHRMAKNGRLPGYAHMNQPSLTNLMGMLFAKKCGIDHPVLDRAIAKTYLYVEDHVGKGSFPYGIHNPQPSQYNNNGTSGSAAFCMALNGSREGTQFFSQLAATAFDGLEKGHASTFFNPFWTALGANLSGPEVTQPFFRNTLWYHNLQRRWDGGYGTSGREGSEAGVALLIYSLPRKVLIITGREADRSVFVSGKEATEIVVRSEIDYENKSTDALIAMLDDPIPQIPYGATKALTKRSDTTIVPKLVQLIASGTERARRHAVGYFNTKCPESEQPARVEFLGQVLRDETQALSVRIAAASALGFGPYGEKAHPYYLDVLRLLDEPRSDQPDPFNRADMKIAYAASRICDAPFEKRLATDKALIYKSALRFMDDKRQDVRGCGSGMLVGMPAEDFPLVADKLVYVLENKDTTYHTYHNASSTSKPAIQVLAGLGVKEGMDYMLDIAFNDKSKWGFRYRMIMATLPLYGANAKPYIPRFEAHPLINKPGDRFTPAWRKVVEQIESDTNPRKLITLDEVRGVEND